MHDDLNKEILRNPILILLFFIYVLYHDKNTVFIGSLSILAAHTASHSHPLNIRAQLTKTLDEVIVIEAVSH